MTVRNSSLLRALSAAALTLATSLALAHGIALVQVLLSMTDVSRLIEVIAGLSQSRARG